MIRALRGVTHRALRFLGLAIGSIARRLEPQTVQAVRVRPWFAIDGDRTLRLDYDLNRDSTVIDLGGYRGDWAVDIFARYGCRIWIFEPVPEFAAAIERRFACNPQVHVEALGLAARDGEARIGLDGDGSSIHRDGRGSVRVELREAGRFLLDHGIEQVDLMKINIEGAEYELLEHLLDQGRTLGIRDIQVQFHDFVVGAEQRREAIHARLSQTHELTYCYPFVWENWRLKPGMVG